MVQHVPHTRFERARIVGARALQIAMGAPVVLGGVSTLDPVRVSEEEYKGDLIPITVAKRAQRVLPPSAAPSGDGARRKSRRDAPKAQVA